MAAKKQYRLEVRFGDDILEAGFTAVPNLFLNNYRDLGISDGAAFWIVHLLKFKWTEDNPYPRRSSIPMNANKDTQKRYARQLRELGLLFTRRIYWSAEDNPPHPHLVGTIRALEYDFTSLFYNVVRISRWKIEGRSLDDFEVEIPPEIMEKVANSHFHHVSNRWKQLCQEHVIATADEEEKLQGENHPIEEADELGGENRTVGLKGENHPLDHPHLGGENHPLELRGDFQPVENHPHNKEDTVSNKRHDSEEEKKQQQQNTWALPEHLSSPNCVAVVSTDELKNLLLQANQVVVNYDSSDSRFTVISISEAVQQELRQRHLNPAYELEIYYSVEHALGEGPDDWTDVELSKIRRKRAIEQELEERYERVGAFTLEDALQQYFSPQFAAQILADKPASELERIEDWIAYVRRQKNLTNPAGFLRTSIESGETAPGLSVERRSLNSGDGNPHPNSVRASASELSSAIRKPQIGEGATEGPEIPDLEVPGTDMTSRELWKATLDELQLQMTRATFDTWLRNSYIVGVGDDHLVVAARSRYAVAWLENRLNPLICRTLAHLLGHPVTVDYESVTIDGSGDVSTMDG